MKISKRDLGLIMILAGVILLVCVYNFVYTKNNEKIETEQAALAELQTTEKGLADLEANMDYYQSEITRMGDEDLEIESHFPSKILPENEIMYAVDMEEAQDVYFTSLSYGSSAAVVTGTEDQTGITGYALPMSMTYQSTYQGLKDVITFTGDQNNRMVIDTVSATFDSTTGNLSGSMELMQYYLEGTDTQYVEPYVPALAIGRDNIFGTFENVSSDTETVEVTAEE